MRILHTSDWHVGTRLGRFYRIEEHLAAVSRVAEIAAAEQGDLVRPPGDVFARPMPPVEALRVALTGLVLLSDEGRRPVVVVAGNHDSPELFEALAPFLQERRIHLVGRIKCPGDGGVGLLVAHCLVGGAAVHAGLPRGERELHMGEAYAVTPQAVPTGLDYVALGHIHAPQGVPGVLVPAEYAGSLLPLDFGEAGGGRRGGRGGGRPG